ncbi:hypothetical protein GQ600_17616 [Phytophthora cactorum]|nr:hypothetical protein GQ600_17616 [Phytophthora cactorum]
MEECASCNLKLYRGKCVFFTRLIKLQKICWKTVSGKWQNLVVLDDLKAALIKITQLAHPTADWSLEIRRIQGEVLAAQPQQDMEAARNLYVNAQGKVWSPDE